MTDPTSPVPALPPLPDLAKTFRQMFNLGQTYWDQADSESYSQNRKSNETAAKFMALSNATIAAIEDYALQAVEAYKEDAALLDWIARQGGDEFSYAVLQDCPGDGDYVVWGMGCQGQGKTFREAIDAAIAAAGSKAK